MRSAFWAAVFVVFHSFIIAFALALSGVNKRANKSANQAIRKVYALKGVTIEDNVIKGASSALGNVDRGGDVVCPGFYSNALEGFRKAGFVAVGHDWGGLPVAMPTLAEERKGELYCEAEYHSTPEAQAARTVAAERKAKGLDVGLSVGFSMRSMRKRQRLPWLKRRSSPKGHSGRRRNSPKPGIPSRGIAWGNWDPNSAVARA